MLDEFRAGNRGHHKIRRRRRRTIRLVHRAAVTPLKNRPVQLAQLLLAFFFLDADHDPVGMEKILYRGSFAQKFRIRGHAKFRPGIRRIHLAAPASAARRSAPAPCSSRSPASACVDSFAIIRATLSIADRSASPVSVGGVPTQIKTTSASRTASRGIRREPQSPFAHHAVQHFVQMRLVNRDFPGLQRGDPRAIVVGRDHFVARFGQTAPRHQAPRTRSQSPPVSRLLSLLNHVPSSFICARTDSRRFLHPTKALSLPRCHANTSQRISIDASGRRIM